MTMFVCICNAVKESQIKKAITAGHHSIEALQAELDVATCCGGCQPMIESYLDEHAQQVVACQNLYIEAVWPLPNSTKDAINPKNFVNKRQFLLW